MRHVDADRSSFVAVDERSAASERVTLTIGRDR